MTLKKITGSKLQDHTKFAGGNQSSPKSIRFFPFTIQKFPENLVQYHSPVLEKFCTHKKKT